MDDFAAIALRSTPLWIIAILIVMVSIGICQIALELTRRAHVQRRAEGGKSPSDLVVTPVFALLAFMLATTFSMALMRFDARRLALMNEVEALSSEYARSSLLDKPYSDQIRAGLRSFTNCRIASANASPSDLRKRTEQCRVLGKELWAKTQEGVLPIKSTAMASLTVTGMNDVLNAAAHRDMAAASLIPTRVLTLLFLCILAASAVLGMTIAPLKRRLPLSVILLLTLYAICFVLILDIDGSNEGSVSVSQKPLQELAAQFDSHSP